MRSAEHAHSIPRRTALAAIAAGPVIGITASAAAAATPPLGGNGLMALWYQRCQALRAWLDYGEGRDPVHELALFHAWSDLDDRIMTTPALTLEDLQAKFALQRDWLQLPEGEVVAYPGEPDQPEDHELDPDTYLILSIITDIERMFEGEMGTAL
jgi:hypothetical protein